MLKIPPPRLLPATIATLAALLLLKCGLLAMTIANHGEKTDSIMVASANAAGAEAAKEHGKPEAAKEHGKPEAAKEHEKPAAPGGASAAQQAASPPAPSIPEGPPPVSASEKALLQELRQRRQELENRADTMTTRESVLVATEQKLVSTGHRTADFAETA